MPPWAASRKKSLVDFVYTTQDIRIYPRHMLTPLSVSRRLRYKVFPWPLDLGDVEQEVNTDTCKSRLRTRNANGTSRSSLSTPLHISGMRHNPLVAHLAYLIFPNHAKYPCLARYTQLLLSIPLHYNQTITQSTMTASGRTIISPSCSAAKTPPICAA